MPSYQDTAPLAPPPSEVFACTADGRDFVRKYVRRGAWHSEARFTREVELLSTLTHPNIVPLIEARLDADPMWFVMPRYRQSLAEAAPTMRRDHAAIARVFTYVLRGLAYAHWKGFIHRDLKPGNVLLNGADDVVIADFGIGRKVNTDTRLTETDSTLGTELYMPPEQRIDAKRATEASDIHALGRMLRELYTGSPLESSDDWRIPLDVRPIVIQCTQFEPRRRFQTVPQLQLAWREAAYRGAREILHSGNTEVFGDVLQSEGVHERDVRPLVALLSRPGRGAGAAYDAMMRIAPAALAATARVNPDVARRVFAAFADGAAHDGGADAASRAAERLEAFLAEVSDDTCRGWLLCGLLKVGVVYNERRALARFGALASHSNPAQLDALVHAMRDQNPATISEAAMMIDVAALPDGVRRVFEQ